jgi:hypothetical protein
MAGAIHGTRDPGRTAPEPQLKARVVVVKSCWAIPSSKVSFAFGARHRPRPCVSGHAGYGRAAQRSALQAALDHDGPARVDVLTARQELSLPPKVTLEQVTGFTLFAIRTILSGQGNELMELAKTNLRQLECE